MPDNLTKDEFYREGRCTYSICSRLICCFFCRVQVVRNGQTGYCIFFNNWHVDTIARRLIEQGKKNYRIKGQLVKGKGCGGIVLEKKRKKNGYRK